MNEDNRVYNMCLDEEDDDDNYAGDDIYNADEVESVQEQSPVTPISLNETIKVLELFAKTTNMKDDDIKHHVFDICLEERLGVHSDVLLGFSDADTEYKTFMTRLVPEFSKITSGNASYKDALQDAMLKATLMLIWLGIEKRTKVEGISVEDLKNAVDGKYNFYCKTADKGLNPFLAVATRDWSEINGDGEKALEGAIKIFFDLKDLLKTREESAITDELPDDDDIEVDSAEVSAITNDIMNIYDRLYRPCFLNRPVGVLTSEGIMSMDQKTGKPYILKNGQNYAKRLYATIANASDGYLPDSTSTAIIDSSFISPEGNLLKTYSPVYHIFNIYGKLQGSDKPEKNWEKYRFALFEDIQNRVRSVLKKVEGDTIPIQGIIKALFTNCIIIDEFNRLKDLRLRLKVDSFQGNVGNIIREDAKNIFAIDTGTLLNSSKDDAGVQNVLYLFDEKAYNAEILFAYKAYEKMIESGGRPSAKNVILGRDLKGNNVTENLDDAGNVITGIIAGSRSGKGVLTLNILASLYADDCPVMYLDYKPDMAATLWEMEKDLTSKGAPCKIFAIDALANRRSDGITPPRMFPYGKGAIPEASLEEADYALLSYLKTMQFAAILAQLRASGIMPNHKKMFFVLDEAQKANGRYGILLEKLNKGLKANAPKGGKNSEPPSDLYKYYEKLLFAFNSDLKDGMRNIINTVGGTGRVSLLVLGQKADPDEWKLDGEGSWKSTLFGNIIGNTNIKIIGRDSGNSAMYGVPALKAVMSGGKLLDERGYFVKFRSAKAPDKGLGANLLKSYLVLNKNDFNLEAYMDGSLSPATFTGGLLTNINDSTTRGNIAMNDLLNPDRSVRESIGFAGLMKLIMGSGEDAELAKKLSIGYECMHDLFCRLGLNQHYSCVEEYLFDCAPESIFTLGELKAILNGDQRVLGTGSKVDWFDGVAQESPSTQNTSFGELGFNGLTSNSETPFGAPINSGSSIPDKELPLTFIDDYGDDSAVNFGATQQKAGADSFDTEALNNAQSITQDPFITPNIKMGYREPYNSSIDVPNSLYQMLGKMPGSASYLYALDSMSELILKEIRKLFTDLNRVETIVIQNSGLMVINNIPFCPKFDKETLQLVSPDMVEPLSKGCIAELFNFRHLYQFKGLYSLEIDSVRLAEVRLRRELGIHPKQSWLLLFKKFKYLKNLRIGNNTITDEPSVEEYERGDYSGFSLTEKLKNAFKMPDITTPSYGMSRFWNSKPAKAVTGALGWTLGLKALTTIAFITGPWGLLFGALAVGGALKHKSNSYNSSAHANYNSPPQEEKKRKR